MFKSLIKAILILVPTISDCTVPDPIHLGTSLCLQKWRIVSVAGDTKHFLAVGKFPYLIKK